MSCTHSRCANYSRRLDSDGSCSVEMNNRSFNGTLYKDILNSTDLWVIQVIKHKKFFMEPTLMRA